jgi:hypothetical protein
LGFSCPFSQGEFRPSRCDHLQFDVSAPGNFDRAVWRARRLGAVDTMEAGGVGGRLGYGSTASLAGYARKAAGKARHLLAIASVVLGSASILGRRGSDMGASAGVVLITLPHSILSVVQMSKATRQINKGRPRDALAVRARKPRAVALSFCVERGCDSCVTPLTAPGGEACSNLRVQSDRHWE